MSSDTSRAAPSASRPSPSPFLDPLGSGGPFGRDNSLSSPVEAFLPSLYSSGLPLTASRLPQTALSPESVVCPWTGRAQPRCRRSHTHTLNSVIWSLSTAAFQTNEALPSHSSHRAPQNEKRRNTWSWAGCDSPWRGEELCRSRGRGSLCAPGLPALAHRCMLKPRGAFSSSGTSARALHALPGALLS